MINYKKLKKQIHRGGGGFVFEPSVEQIEESDWELFPICHKSKRRLLRTLRFLIYHPESVFWKKYFKL